VMAMFMTSDTYSYATEVIGTWILRRWHFILEISRQALQTIISLVSHPSFGNPAIRTVLFKQIYFTGLEAAKIIVLVALILGTVIVSQVLGLLGGGNGSLTGKVLVWVVFLELGPLLTAMIVIARSGTAIAAELGSMKINGEVAVLERLGIHPERYLLLPRVIGVGVAVFLLTVYFVLTAFIGGFLLVSVGRHVPYDQFLQGILASLGLREVAVLVVKTFAFGTIIPLICCNAGMSVGTSATEIPQAATRAVITSLFAVFVLDGLITYLSSLLAIA
jgi:phospholipid/cholesterol/gamma-HCH transport system permease protein